MSEVPMTKAEPNGGERLAWHKPEVRRLTISQGTAVPKTGSGEDGGFLAYSGNGD